MRLYFKLKKKIDKRVDIKIHMVYSIYIAFKRDNPQLYFLRDV